MQLHGTIDRNVVSALRSARRLRGQSVHPDTVDHWKDVLALAESDLSCGGSADRQDLKRLVSELRAELESRERWHAP